VDPNQENGLLWYAAIQKERGGISAANEAFQKIADQPGSWRARLWLARTALEKKDIAVAESLYREALTMAGETTPYDLLMQMSGDLGKNGFLKEVICLTKPYYIPSLHGLEVGNNLIKANIELGNLEEAKQVIDHLYGQKRPDWKETLHFLENELAKAEIAGTAPSISEQLSVVNLSIEGPLWMRDGSPFSPFLPEKSSTAPRIGVFCSTVIFSEIGERPRLEWIDGPGRLSRAIPLILAEHIHLTTEATGVAFIPWVQEQGFAVFGKPYSDSDLCVMAGKDENTPSLVAGIVLDATQSPWKLILRLLQRSDGGCLAELTVKTNSNHPGLCVDQLTESLVKLLRTHAGIHGQKTPMWYDRPQGTDATDYLCHIEQQLAIMAVTTDSLKGGRLHGERNMLDVILALCLRKPENQTVRMIYFQTLRQIKKIRPDILFEYKDKTLLLKDRFPISGELGRIFENTFTEIFAI